MDAPLIYHLTTPGEWHRAQGTGNYAAPSLAAQGFIHCSEAGQVEGVLQRYFSGAAEVLKLTIEVARLVHPPRYERAESIHEHFPHIYGPINIDAVIAVEPIR